MAMDQGGWLWLVIDVLAVVALAGALIYGLSTWRKRRTDPDTVRRAREATHRLYHHDEAVAEEAAERGRTVPPPAGHR
jgi:hypothetical protein